LNSVRFRATMVAVKTAGLLGKLPIPPFDSDRRSSGQAAVKVSAVSSC
jgi:hypothetical protein